MTDLCPECGHQRGRPQSHWLRHRLGMRIPAATCWESDSGLNSGGWPGPCGCSHPFHGS